MKLSDIRTEDLSAFAGIDFVAVDRQLIFDPWVTSLDVQVTLINDEIKKPHANFIVLVDNVVNGVAGKPNRSNVALLDDDSEYPITIKV